MQRWGPPGRMARWVVPMGVSRDVVHGKVYKPDSVCVDISSGGRRLGSADSGGVGGGWLERGCAELGGVGQRMAVGGSG